MDEISLSKDQQQDIVDLFDRAWAIIANANDYQWSDLDWSEAAQSFRAQPFGWRMHSRLYGQHLKDLKLKEEELMTLKKSKKTKKSNLFTDADIKFENFFIPKWKKFGPKELKIIQEHDIDLDLFQHKKLKLSHIDSDGLIEAYDESGNEVHYFPFSILKSVEKTAGPVTIDFEEIEDPDGENTENFSGSRITFYNEHVEILNDDYEHHLMISKQHVSKLIDLFSSWLKNESLENFLNKEDSSEEDEDEIEKDPDDDDEDEDDDEDDDEDMSLEAVSERIKEGIV